MDASNQQQGPVDEVTFMNLRLPSNTLIWCKGMDRWRPAYDVFNQEQLYTPNSIPNTQSPQYNQTTHDYYQAKQPKQPYPSRASTLEGGPLMECPECGKMTDSLKCFILPHYTLFLFCYAQWQNIKYICCPSCMRKHIGIKCFTYNIVAANFMWPFIVLPWGVTQLIRTGMKGHSTTVKKMIEGNY